MFEIVKPLLLTLLFSLSFFTSNAQWGSQAYYGYIVPHRAEMQHLVQGHSFGGSLQYLKKLTGEKPWHYFYNFPEIGGELTFVNTGNAQQLGNQISSSFLLKLPLNKFNLSTESKFKHYLNLGIGLGYSTKIWDLKENTQALVLGSHFNASVILHYEAALWTRSKYQVTMGLRIHHFSNGAFQLPNLGTNNISISTGFRFLENKSNGTTPPEPKSFKEWRTYISMVGGLKEISPPTGKKYGSYTLSFLQERRVNYKSAFGLGIDAMYSSSIKALRERLENTTVSFGETMQLGMVFSYNMFFNEFQLKIQQGVYLLHPFGGDGSLYHRVALRYPIAKNLHAHLGLKTHFAKADHAEFGLVYQL